MSGSPSTRLRVGWHRFGRAPEGYRTLASSADLPAATADALARFSWGQTADRAYLDSLVSRPAVWVEPVAGAVAVTRVGAGPSDRSGRSTLQFDSLVVDRVDYAERLLPALSALIADGGAFEGRRLDPCDLVPIDPVPPSARVRRLGAALRDPSLDGASLLLAPSSIDLDELVAALLTLPVDRRAEIAFGYRALTDALDARIVVLDRAHRPEPADHSRAELALDAAEPSAARPSVAHVVARRPSTSDRRRSALAQRASAQELTMTPKTVLAFAALALLVLTLGATDLTLAQRERGTLADLRDELAAEVVRGAERGQRLDEVARVQVLGLEQLQDTVDAGDQRLQGTELPALHAAIHDVASGQGAARADLALVRAELRGAEHELAALRAEIRAELAAVQASLAELEAAAESDPEPLPADDEASLSVAGADAPPAAEELP